MYRICLYQGTHSTGHTSMRMGIAICSNMQRRDNLSETAVSKISYCLKSKGRVSFAEILESFINFLRSLSKSFDIQIILFLKGLSCHHHGFFLSSIVNWSSYVLGPSICILKVVCVWIWPMSAHTDMCMDKHKIDVHALPIFRRRTGRHMQGHTHILFILRQLPFHQCNLHRKQNRPLTM